LPPVPLGTKRGSAFGATPARAFGNRLFPLFAPNEAD